jgi:DnaK suppressor protein
VSHLSEDQIEELRLELDRQLARLRRSMRVTEEAARPVELDQTAVGRLSRMDSIQNQQLTKNLQEREGIRLALLERALQRIASGSYGICSECGGPTPFDRLFVVPEAPDCGRCDGPLPRGG